VSSVFCCLISSWPILIISVGQIEGQVSNTEILGWTGRIVEPKPALEVLDFFTQRTTGKECLFQLPIFIEHSCLNDKTFDDVLPC
jgi:hypothetical protein